jgi:hypothetical protein
MSTCRKCGQPIIFRYMDGICTPIHIEGGCNDDRKTQPTPVVHYAANGLGSCGATAGAFGWTSSALRGINILVLTGSGSLFAQTHPLLAFRDGFSLRLLFCDGVGYPIPDSSQELSAGQAGHCLGRPSAGNLARAAHFRTTFSSSDTKGIGAS